MGMTQVYRLVEEIWIDAPPERVFRALTDPEQLIAWWGVSEAYRTTEATVDLRVGGRYRLTGPSGERGTFAVEGVYRAVEPPTRLVFTWDPGWDDDARGSEVEFALEAREGGTRLVLTHTGFATEESRDAHRGWSAVLSSLKAHCERG